MSAYTTAPCTWYIPNKQSDPAICVMRNTPKTHLGSDSKRKTKKKSGPKADPFFATAARHQIEVFPKAPRNEKNANASAVCIAEKGFHPEGRQFRNQRLPVYVHDRSAFLNVKRSFYLSPLNVSPTLTLTGKVCSTAAEQEKSLANEKRKKSPHQNSFLSTVDACYVR